MVRSVTVSLNFDCPGNLIFKKVRRITARAAYDLVNSKKRKRPMNINKPTVSQAVAITSSVAMFAALLSGCLETDAQTTPATRISTQSIGGTMDITNAMLTETSGDCGDYGGQLIATAHDIQGARTYQQNVQITANSGSCIIASNNIPNHDMNAAPAHFASPIAEVPHTFSVARNPQVAAQTTALSQRSYDAVMLNGVVLDILSAGCYRPNDHRADVDGNVAIGCRETDPWLLDPLGTDTRFGADAHNAHTQPDGLYHYHGNPMALFDDAPGVNGSPVIGFAADGFPIFGSYFVDTGGNLREAQSGYTLQSGSRPSSASNPGGSYDGMYVGDWSYTNAGDLDACNGMTVNGQYGYYVTDSYPWVMACFTGTPDSSFNKRR
jgi:hypothetical protein